LIAAAALALLPATARAQVHAPPAWRWSVSVTGGFVVWPDALWNAVDAALQAGNWGSLGAGCGFLNCRSPSDVATESRIAPTVTARYHLRAGLALRALASWVRPGLYPASNASFSAEVRPSVVTLGVQAALEAGPLWIAAGPSLNRGLVTVNGPLTDNTATGISPGFVVGAGIDYPRHQKMFVAVSIERRFASSVDLPATPVAGAAQPVPAMSVPLSLTLLTFGVGWHF
jgi:hypothetical protein